MQTELVAQCEGCVYWVQSEEDIGFDVGTCHRFPHQTVKGAGDFCGEFDPGPGDDDGDETLDDIDAVARYYENDSRGCRIYLDEDDEDDLEIEDEEIISHGWGDDSALYEDWVDGYEPRLR